MKPKFILSTLIMVFLFLITCTKDYAQATYKPGDFPGPNKSIDDYNETILQIDLGKEIGLYGRIFRMHYSTMSPKGMILQHKHANRPTIEYILQGDAMETKFDTITKKVIVNTIHANENESSTGSIIHWWKNETRGMVKIMATDIWIGNGSIVCRPQGDPRTEALVPPSNPDNVKTEELARIELEQQFPDLPAAKGYIMRSRRLTILSGQKTKLENYTGKPAITYIISGDILENRSDEKSLIRRAGEYSVGNNGISYYWENPTQEQVILWIVDIIKKEELKN